MRRFHGAAQNAARRENIGIRAGELLQRLARAVAGQGPVLVKMRLTAAADAQVGHARLAEEGAHHGLGLHAVGGRVYLHARQETQRAHVLGGVVRHAQRTVDEACAHAHDLHVRLMVGAAVADLLQTAQRGKVADGIDHHRLALQRHAGGHAHHGLLRNAGVDEAVGEFLHIRKQHAKAQVAGDQHQLGVRFGVGFQAAGEGVSHGLPASSSFSAASYSSPRAVR